MVHQMPCMEYKKMDQWIQFFLKWLHHLIKYTPEERNLFQNVIKDSCSCYSCVCLVFPTYSLIWFGLVFLFSLVFYMYFAYQLVRVLPFGSGSNVPPSTASSTLPAQPFSTLSPAAAATTPPTQSITPATPMPSSAPAETFES